VAQRNTRPSGKSNRAAAGARARAVKLADDRFSHLAPPATARREPRHGLDIEAALNACLLELCSCQLDASHEAEFVVTLIDFPQCRGEGATIGAALQRARYEFGCIRDCRTAWQLDAAIKPAFHSSRR
jgi:hypothetical protein